MYSHLGELDQSIARLNDALRQAQAGGYERLAANVSGNLGVMYNETGNLDLAEIYYRTGISEGIRLEMSREAGYYTIGLASLIAQMKRSNSLMTTWS